MPPLSISDTIPELYENVMVIGYPMVSSRESTFFSGTLSVTAHSLLVRVVIIYV